MDDTERSLLRQYFTNHRMYAEVNGRSFEVLYSSRFDGDTLPWIALTDPSLRFVSAVVTAEVVRCVACEIEIGPHIRYRPDFPLMDRCETCAVAELYGDLIQYQAGTLKL